MKKLLFLLYLALFLAFLGLGMALAEEPGVNWEEISSDQFLIELERQSTELILSDMAFLCSKSSTSFIEEMKSLKYVHQDDDNDPLRPPSDIFYNGGDCDDFAIFVLARLSQYKVGSDRGLILLWCPPKKQAHIAAVFFDAEKETIFVVDPQAPGVVLPVDDYTRLYARDSQATIVKVRAWWFGKTLVKSQSPVREFTYKDGKLIWNIE